MYAPQFQVAACPRSRPTTRAGLLLALIAGITACVEEHSSAPRQETVERAVASAAGRPNIVVIMTDDQTLESMRVMPLTRSLIGSAGVTFDNSVVTYALCCPSRATFLTGQYSHNHGVRSNAPPEGGHAKLDDTNTLPLWLQGAGYVTSLVGKYLNGYGRVDKLELPPGWTEWHVASANTADKYYNYRLNENGTLVQYGATPAQYLSDLTTDKAVDFIRRRAPDAAGGVRPFFLYVAYLAPHVGTPKEPGDPSMATAVRAPRHKGRFAGELLPSSPAFNEANMSDKPASMRSRPLLTPTQVREIGEVYRQGLEALLAVDEGVSRIIDALRVGAVLENTLVIFTSDNGYFHGEHRVPSGKILPYEPAVKVPLLIRGPGVASGLRIPAMVANVDLPATIVAAAGATAGLTIDGRSLWPFLSGAQTAWPGGPRHVLVEDSRRGTAATIFLSIKRGQYVYTEYANGNRELYDLRTDPNQITSRHGAPAYATIRRQLATRLAAMKACIGPTACW
jgi:N-acetylglucosamine-6-sulfatase